MASTIPTFKVMGITALIAHVHVLLVRAELTGDVVAVVAAVAAEGALCVELDDGFGVVRVADVLAAAAETGLYGAVVGGAFAAGEEVLAHVAELVGAGARWLADFAAGAAFGVAGHCGRGVGEGLRGGMVVWIPLGILCYVWCMVCEAMG